MSVLSGSTKDLTCHAEKTNPWSRRVFCSVPSFIFFLTCCCDFTDTQQQESSCYRWTDLHMDRDGDSGKWVTQRRPHTFQKWIESRKLKKGFRWRSKGAFSWTVFINYILQSSKNMILTDEMKRPNTTL